MKTITFLFSILITYTSILFAAELNLNSGDRVTIRANTDTTVTCNGAAADPCAVKVNYLNSALSNCEKSYSGAYCISKFWPDFKSENPDCYYSAYPVCVDHCTKSYSGAYCSDYCGQ